MIGTTLAHYRITGELGAGGMGEVWRAKDEKLGREVALKVLSEEFADDPRRLERFEREARAVASLSHPHIVTIFSVEDADGVHFLTMELVEGRTLDKLIPEGGLDAETFFDLATPLAEAVSAAHAKSVVHRDLKPTNVMVDNEGRVKVMDFGLAKMQETADPSDSSELPTEALTGVGMVVGTVPYMSPEQVEGKIVDHRTDVFSLGVLLYEMATGERPFQGDSGPALMSSILRDAPSSVVEMRADLPRHLGRIVARCLEKDRRDRYQTARDVFNELKALRLESQSLASRPARPPSAAPRPPAPRHASAGSGVARQDEGFWVAVLPFQARAADEAVAALAEGLTDDIVTGMSRFSYLRVISRSSTARYATESHDIRRVGEDLGARYVMEGSLRRAGTALRVTVQLTDAESGAHLWAETYNRPFDSEAVFELQDDLAPRIVSTVADMNGVLPHSMGEALRGKDSQELTPYEAMLLAFSYYETIAVEDHTRAKDALERAVQEAPGHADCWALLSMLYADEYKQGFNTGPEPLDRALEAARRAATLAPLNNLAYHMLAQAHFFRREFKAFRGAAEKAVSLNPMDGCTTAFLGILMAYAGDWDHGCALAERAMELNPHHPGWYRFSICFNRVRQRDFEGALDVALKFNMPTYFYTHATLAAIYGQLGDVEAAGTAVRELQRLKPDFAEGAREEYKKWVGEGELLDLLVEGLEKAGLKVPGETVPRPKSPDSGVTQSTTSAATHADEGFWVAVLPFTYTGGDGSVAALAEGLSDEIVTGLSRFSYLRVIARSSTLRYAGQGTDVRSVGEELGARYVMEGTLRQAGRKLRVAVQLVDASSGAHLWAENYERVFDAETVFEVQDELVPRIVSTVADWYGALPLSMSETVRQRSPDQLTPYEAVLRSFGYFGRISPDEHAIVRAALERAVEQSPGDAYAWAMLSMMYGEEHRFGFNVQPDPLGRSLAAARRAVDVASANNIAWLALAQALFFRKEYDAFHDAAERAIALNTMDGSTLEYVGHLMAFAGRWERGCEVSERARHLNPNHPGWYWVVHCLDAYRQGDYEASRDFLLKALHRGGGAQVFTQSLLAALQGQLGELEAAQQTLHSVLGQQPEFALVVREEYGKWYLPELVEQLMDGLRKAGLEITDDEDHAATAPDLGVSGEERAEEGFWVAVSPFKASSSDADLVALAEGLTEDIVTGLSRFSYLRVIARGSATTGARYVMEGSLRKAGRKLRVAVQLVDTESGAHLWAEAYDRDFDPDELFALQDDLVPRIVSTSADHFGVLARAISEAVRGKPVVEMTPYEALMRGFGYHFRLTPEEHAEARDALEQAVEQAPSNADCWAMLAWVYAHEFAHDFNPRPNSLDRALEAARRAVDIAPSNHVAQQVLAVVLFFRKEIAGCRRAAERAMELNPLDGSNEAFFLITFTGEWERGCALIRGGMELNPHHPGWYRAPLAANEYRKQDYRAAIDEAVTANSPEVFWFNIFLAAAHSQLGELEAAKKAVENLRAQKPDFARSGRELMGKWFEPELVEHLIDGLRKAGLEMGSVELPRSAPPSADEVVSEAAASPSIAVLPFINMSADRDNDFFSDGLSEEIINALTRLSGLRVIARSSAFRFRGEQDLRKVGEALGVRNVLEGSVRKAGERLRITAQLIDVTDHSHVWSERFDREMTDVFEIQDEIASAIVDKLDVSLAADEPARRQTASVEAYEAFLEGRHHFSQFTPESVELALGCFQRALSLDPEYADALAFFGFYHLTKAYMFEDPREMLPKVREYAEKALEVDSNHGEAQAAVAVVWVMLDRDWSANERLFQRALEMAPASARVHELYGLCCLLGQGRFEEALAELDLALKLDPLSALYAGNRGRVLTCWRRFKEAQESCRRGLVLDSRQLLVQVELTYALLFDGQVEEAIAVGEQAIETHGPVNAPRQALALSYALAGRRDEAFELVADEPGAGYRSPLARGLVHAAFDEMDEAFACVEQSFEERDPLLIYLAVHPIFDNLRGDPRYSDLVRRMNLPELDAPTEPEIGRERHTVGRLEELDSLRAALEAARDGRGSLMCVAGEPGIGKTTVVEEFLAEAAADGGCVVARGRSSERIGDSDAYLPVLEALGSLLGTEDGPAIEQVIKRLAPAWYAQIAPISDDSGESVEARAATQERLKLDFVACIQELSGSRPLVLFLDDLHWADESTVDLLSFLAGKFEGAKVLVVVTYRPSDMQLVNHPFLQIKPDLQTRGVCREIQLDFLSEPEIAEYLAIEFPGHGFPAEFPAAVLQKTEGSPLFMADLVRYLRDRGAIGQIDGEWRLLQGLPEIERELPESVRGMIERKIGQLEEGDHELLTVASVQGYAFDSAIVAQVLDIAPEEIEERLEDLEGVHAFVRLTGETELPDRTLTLRYRFVHVLYQNALYGSLKPTRKARLSREVGEALEGAHGRKVRVVAHELAALFEAGREPSRAAKYYLVAASQANAVFAHREAATLAKQGVEMVEMLDLSPERSRTELELQLALGLALRSFRGFGHSETGKAYSRARELCHEIGDAPQLFPVLFGLWEFFQNQGDQEAAVDVGKQMLVLAEKSDDLGQRVAAHAVMADNLICVGDPVPSTEHAARALELYEPGEHGSLASLFGYDPAVSAHSLGSLALWLAGFPEHAIREATEGAALAEKISDPATQAFGPLFASWIRQLTGSAEKAVEMADRCIGIATEIEMPMFRDFGRVLRGWTLITKGEVEEGTELARAGVDGLQAIEFGWGRSFTLGVVAQGCVGMERTGEALELLEQAIEHAHGTGEGFHEAELHRLKGEFLLASEPFESERCFTSALEVAQRQQAKSYELRAATSLARLWAEQGRFAEAHQKLEGVYSWFTEGFNTADLRSAKALLEELTAAKNETGTADDAQQAEGDAKSIVVLPFANLSPDPDTEYFSDGLTDEIITDLSRVRSLRVISRSSAMRLKGDERDLAAISRDLGCRYALEGSVRRAANDLRITARLVDAPADVQVWADKYTGSLHDVFDIQERVSRSIVDALEIQLTPQEAKQLAERPIDDVRAQESYLRARSEIWSFMPGSLDLAISHLEAALGLIGDNALIYQGLGEAYFQYVNIGAAVGREEELVGKAEGCAEKIFELEPESPRGYLVRAQTRMARGEIHGSCRDLKRVLQVYPQEIMALALYTHLLGWLGGKPEAAAPGAARLADIDPLNPMSRLVCAMVPLFSGRFDEAVEATRRMFELDPVTPVWRANHVMALSYARRFDEAEALIETIDPQPDSDVGTWQMGLFRAAWREDRAEVLRLADGPYRQLALWDAEAPWFLALAYAAVGEADEAMLWLDRAIDHGMINYPFFSEHDWYLDTIRGDERFERAMEKAKREWERLDEVLG